MIFTLDKILLTRADIEDRERFKCAIRYMRCWTIILFL